MTIKIVGARRAGFTAFEGSRSLLLAAAALSMAVFGPDIRVRQSVVDVLVVLDITQSMNVMDVSLHDRPVSRLDYGKAVLGEAVGKMPCGSKVGLGIFTEYRTFVMLVPLEVCANRRELRDSIEHVDGRMAWAGDSQIAKGLFSALILAKSIDSHPAVAFITDGHEAPPLNPRHRPEFPGGPAAGDPAAIKGAVLGVGGADPRPIPKVDPDGNVIGLWAADEVLQADLYTVGRQGNETHESMVELEPAMPVPAALAATPGLEHLSYRHESYLRLLATENRLRYDTLGGADELTRVLRAPDMTQTAMGLLHWRWFAALTALLALAWQHRRS